MQKFDHSTTLNTILFFKLNFIHFFKVFGLLEPPPPRNFQSLLWEEYGDFLELHIERNMAIRFSAVAMYENGRVAINFEKCMLINREIKNTNTKNKD